MKNVEESTRERKEESGQLTMSQKVEKRGGRNHGKDPIDRLRRERSEAKE